MSGPWLVLSTPNFRRNVHTRFQWTGNTRTFPYSYFSQTDYTSGFIGLLSCSCLRDDFHTATCVVCAVVDWTADVRRRADVVDVIEHWPLRRLLRWRQRLIDVTRCSGNHDNWTRVLCDRLVLRNQSASWMLSLAPRSASISIANNDFLAFCSARRLVVRHLRSSLSRLLRTAFAFLRRSCVWT